MALLSGRVRASADLHRDRHSDAGAAKDGPRFAAPEKADHGNPPRGADPSMADRIPPPAALRAHCTPSNMRSSTPAARRSGGFWAEPAEADRLGEAPTRSPTVLRIRDINGTGRPLKAAELPSPHLERSLRPRSSGKAPPGVTRTSPMANCTPRWCDGEQPQALGAGKGDRSRSIAMIPEAAVASR